jgi:Arc/MetJ-type ribon-helix-helix transcriptional regulator
MIVRMTEATIVQARLAPEDTAQIDADRAVLGLATRSDAIREGLRLLHQQARYVALAQDYDAFYGATEAPMSDIAAIGDLVAVDSMTPEA